MKKHIPNSITCLNLLSGCVACVLAIRGNFTFALAFVFAAGIFDFLDGMVARLLHVQSEIGKELDSLADVVSFGLAPAAMLFFLLEAITEEMSPLANSLLPCLAFLLTAFSAIRLAKFNIDTRQTSAFLGLPTPANALFWTSLCYSLVNWEPAYNPFTLYVLIVLVVCFSALMVVDVPMFSLKLKNFAPKGDTLKLYFVALCAIAFVALFGVAGIACTMGVYVLLNILFFLIKISK
jgi:CDP-diacylglycerol--serine O-phosphatidyltransferase